MSWKVHGTDEVFAALRGLCSNSYRVYDPSEHRSYYDHDCDAYECAVEDAAQEYERLLRHCDHQRAQLKAWGNVPTLRKIMEDGMDNIGGGTEVERIEGSSITDELREYAKEHECESYCRLLTAIADRIDAEHAKAVELAYGDGVMSVPIALDESQWVKLPLDADGVPIHVGDELEIEHNGRVTTVDVMTLLEDGWTVYCTSGGAFVPSQTRCHHVQPDSWERIIADAVKNGMYDHDNERIQQKLVERCRRLAGDAE